MKIVFMGTPDFAVPCLEMLVTEKHDVVAVVTQPDKPVGRKQSILQFSPVKEAAIKCGVKIILQPEKIKTPEFLETIKNIAPDLIITAAYGKILPKSILDIPVLGCINVHGSLLPKYRGAAPIQWAIINGEAESGITTMFMDEGMDTGDILLKKAIPITDDMNFNELYEQLKTLGAVVLKDTLEKLKFGKLKRVPQDNSIATTVPMMKKEMGQIDWSKSAQEIHNFVRGTNPWPGAFTYYRGEKIKIWKTKYDKSNKNISNQPGKILKINKENLVVATIKGDLEIYEVQFESGKKMEVAKCGHNMNAGEIFG